MKNLTISILFFSLILVAGCTGGSKTEPRSVSNVNSSSHSGCRVQGTPVVSLTIKAVPGGCSIQRPFTKYLNVFGVHVFATNSVPDHKLLHGGNVLAQYLDNDEDGKPDDMKVLKAMTDESASLVMATEDEFEIFLESDLPEDIIFQDLLLDETRPEFHRGDRSRFDASLEEVLHLVQSTGWAMAYPEVFGTESDSRLAKAMDKARGGHFEDLPDEYPEEAWYAYMDESCDYGCQVIEYSYWVTTTFLGAQDYAGRQDEIGEEWKMTTKSNLMSKDSGWKVIASKDFKQPVQKLPDGEYLGPVAK